MRVLNVDDLAENRYLLEFMLTSAGHEVVSVADGQAALEAALRERFDLVCSDVLMPRMDGFQLCRELKSRAGTRAVPFVFYTATYTDEKDQELGLSLGAARYVLKPQEPQAFLRTIREVIEEAAARPAEPPPTIAPEEEFLVAYKQTLVRKLDAKVAELRASEAALAAAQRLAGLGSWELRAPEGPGALGAVPLRASAALAGLLGTAEVPRKVADLLQAVPEPGQSHLEAALRAGLGGEASQELEHELQRPDGSRLRVLTRIEAGAPVGSGARQLLGVTQDVTERRRLEGVVRQAQKMETMGRMAAGIAHDFNNVLSAILLNAEGLLSGPTLAAGDREAVEEMVQAGERAAQLSRQLLTFAQRRALVSERRDLRGVVEGMVAMLRRIVDGRISLECRLDEVPLPVLGDANMLEQVLMNLVVNARDAMPAGGVVTVEAERVEVEAGREGRVPGARPGPAARLAVADAGSGIAPEHLPRLFDPFFTTKPRGKGTGLGLATVYGIVQQHRGWIEVESAVGRGSRFEVYLPLAGAEEAAARSARPAPASPARGERVLLVEDDAAVRGAAVRHLRQIGYRVAEAGDADSALAAWREAREDPLDLLVTDLILPGKMDGAELARHLRRDRAGLRVLFVTGYGGDAVEGLVGGDAALLAKPLTPGRLERAIRQCLDEPS
jgi:signal transduction histidine kinase